jgi:hypothetical protein
VGAIVCIASSNAGATSQDLKTGFLVGALLSALARGPMLLQLNDAATVYVPASEVAPGVVASGPLAGSEALQGPQAATDPRRFRVWHKPKAVDGPTGKYLVDASGRLAHRDTAARNAANDSRAGVLLASGYLVGGALAGVVIAFSTGLLGGFDRALGDWAAAHNLFRRALRRPALAAAGAVVSRRPDAWVRVERRFTRRDRLRLASVRPWRG